MQLKGKEIIRKVEGACLAGRGCLKASPLCYSLLEPMSATSKSLGLTLEVWRLGPRGEEETAYAELRLLFEADVSTAGQWRCQIEYLFN